MTMKTAMMSWTLGLSVAALSLGGIAYAQQASAPKSTMDGDGDGVVTRAEAQQKAADLFAKLDVNKDGKIDQSDRAARREDMRGKMFERLDADKDGSISRTEFMAGKGRSGDRPPAPGDDAPPRMAAPGGDDMHGMPDMHGDMHGMGGMHRMRGDRGGMMLRMADANRDGVVTRDEFTAAAMKHFDMADADHDGKLTKEERQAAHAKMKAQWMAKKGGAAPETD